MNKNRFIYIINILLPCVVFSLICGSASAILIFLFKLSASETIALSGRIYEAVRADMRFLPLLILGAALLGLVAGILLRRSNDCRGGGIPTAIAALRGYVPLERMRGVITVFVSSMMTYFCGVPLGTEGPSVQMGTLVGRITSRIFGKKHPAWERYIMTGGACAGFSAATGAPITGIFFAFEEAHRRFSPMIFMIASMTVVASTVTGEILSGITGVSARLFHFELAGSLPIRYIWIVVILGLICGIMAALFTKAYSFIRRTTEKKLEALPFTLEIALIFAAVALTGFFSEDLIGTGHPLIDKLVEGYDKWYFLLLCLCIRAVMLIVANTQGVTGGLFIPTLAFGAMIGALCGNITVSIGLLPSEYYTVIVVIGMVSFLSASSRTPITALMFAVEALSGISNILPITVGVTIAFVLIELAGIKSFTDTVIEGKTEKYNEGHTVSTIDAYLTVGENAFVIGKEIRDILWPSACVIVSVNNAISSARIGSGMANGDVLHVHCMTSHPERTAMELEALVGKQSFDICDRAGATRRNDEVPDT